MNQKCLYNCALKFMSVNFRRPGIKHITGRGSTSPLNVSRNTACIRNYSTEEINEVQLITLTEKQKKSMVRFGRFSRLEDVPDKVSRDFYDNYLWVVRIRYTTVGIICWFIVAFSVVLYWDKATKEEQHKIMHEQFTDYMSDKDKAEYLAQFEKKN